MSGELWAEPGEPEAKPDAALDMAFARLLRALRALPGPCEPPVGVGGFDILYASEREVVVWYAPARDGVEQREVAIPGGLVRAAWALTRRGAPVDEAALRALAASPGRGRWLLALLAQVPGVETRRGEAPTLVEDSPVENTPDGEADAGQTAPDEPYVTLIWRGERDDASA
ncbi:MAG TPA: hypothetical protein VF808_10055 [Ktedonobacterales bacterium]